MVPRKTFIQRGASISAVVAALVAAASIPALAIAGARSGGAGPAPQSQEALKHVIVTGPGAARAVAASGATVRRELPLLRGVAATVTPAQLRQIESARGVAGVAVDNRIALNGTGPVEFPSLSTIYPLVDGADVGWKRGFDGTGVGIAVIDSGTTPATDFGDRLVQVRLPGQQGSLDDAVGHGSLVAGIAAGRSPDGRYVGIAPGATVFAINVARPHGLYSSDVIDGIQWVLKHDRQLGIRIVVLALSETSPSFYQKSQLDAAVEALWSDGIVVVTSSGNAGPETANVAPANDPFVITVGSTDTMDTVTTDDDVLAPFTSTGTPGGYRKPELLAPGRHIVSVLAPGSLYERTAPLENLVSPGYVMINGSSFSAPQVAGAAALLLEANPTWSPDQVKHVLKTTARPVAGTDIRALDLSRAFTGNPGKVKQQQFPVSKASGGGGTISSWDSSSWSASSWNGSSWNASSWNSSSWNSSSWNTSSWN